MSANTIVSRAVPNKKLHIGDIVSVPVIYDESKFY